MTSTPPDAAVRRAMQDWESQQAVRLVVGTMDPRQPVLHRDSGLYFETYKFAATEDDLKFCDLYNESISSFLSGHGIPDWIPGKRLPSREQAIALLEGATTFDRFQAVRPSEERLVRYVVKHSTYDPSVWTRIDDRGLLLLGGNVNRTAGRIDVLDLIHKKWMAIFEYVRRDVPVLPWD